MDRYDAGQTHALINHVTHIIENNIEKQTVQNEVLQKKKKKQTQHLNSIQFNTFFVNAIFAETMTMNNLLRILNVILSVVFLFYYRGLQIHKLNFR